MPFKPTAPRAGLVRGEHLSSSVPEHIAEHCAWTFRTLKKCVARHGNSVAVAPAQSQLKPEAEPSLAKAQPELPSDGSHILANSSSG